MNKGLVVIISINIFLLLILNFFPYPELFVYPYLTAHGAVPYSQIFDQHFPGIMFFPINLYTLGFRSVEAMRLIELLVVVSNQVLIYKIATKLIKEKKYWLFPSILYLIWQPFLEGWVLWIDSMITPLILLSFYLLLKSEFKKIKYLFFAGLVLGVTLTFKQILVPIIGVVSILLLLKTKNFKIFTLFCVGAATPALLMILYINSIGIWQQFYYWTFTFNVTTYAEFGRKYATLGEIVKISPLIFLSLLVGLVAIYKKAKFEIILLFSFFVMCLLFAYARFDFVHLQPAIPFAALLLVIGFLYIPKKYAVWLATGYLILVSLLVLRFYVMNIGGKVYFWGGDETTLFSEIKSQTNPGDTIFALATLPHVYPATQTMPPSNLFVFPFPWFMMETQGEILDGIKKELPKLIIRDGKAQMDGMILVEYMKDIDNFLVQNYIFDKKIGSVEIWKLK